MNTENTEYWSVRKTAEHFNLSISTIHQLLKKRVIPYVRIGSNIRIKKADIEAIEEKNYVPKKRVRPF